MPELLFLQSITVKTFTYTDYAPGTGGTSTGVGRCYKQTEWKDIRYRKNTEKATLESYKTYPQVSCVDLTTRHGFRGVPPVCSDFVTYSVSS